MPKSSTPQTPFNGFVSCELSEADTEPIYTMAENPAALMAAIAEVVVAGYKLTIGDKPGEDGYQAALFDVLPQRSSYGYMLTARGPGVLIALSAVMYKHVGLMSSEWTPFLKSNPRSKGLR